MTRETRRGSAWPDEHLQFALARWSQGDSAGAIADLLGRNFNWRTTRNAVIGQINRHATPEVRRSKFASRLNMGHNKGNKQRRPKNKTRRALRQKPLTPLQMIRLEGTPLPLRQETDIARVSFNDLEPGKHCRFIPETDGPFKLDKPHYCGLKPVPGLPYCPAHSQRCYGPPKPFAPQPYQSPASAIAAKLRYREFA